ncbi:MAG TPA: tetratricopeptide repeat protein [Myxococcota bacterium]|nr:tetratricopeptide repeat protein [Myxococcota bacterium]
MPTLILRVALAWLVGVPASAATPSPQDPNKLIKGGVCHGLNVDACFLLGWDAFDHRELGGAAKVREALNAFDAACQQGHGASCLWLGVRVATGYGGDRPTSDAVTAYDRACQAGNPIGCLNLGIAQEAAKAAPEVALHAYQRACDGGELQGCGLVGQLMLGQGRDVTRAVDLLKRACEGAEIDACRSLAHLYHAGGPGVSADEVAATRFQRRACLAGDTSSCDTHEMTATDE